MSTLTLKDIKSSYRVAIKGLIKNADGKILMVRERAKTWDLPGGGLDHHEQIIPALEREFEEELGVKVKVTSSAPQVYPTWNTKFDDPVLLVVYVCELDGTPNITEEVGEFDYLDLALVDAADLDSTLTAEIVKALLS